MAELLYRVQTFRDAGLQCKWSRNRSGAPIIVVRDPNSIKPHQREQWWFVSVSMWAAMKKHGIKEGFDCTTILGDMFSIRV